MNLEEILKFLKSIDVDGIEILPDQMIHGAPNPSDETLAKWDELMAKYPIGLACDDCFLNTNMFKNRELTKRECVELIKQEIKLAHRLGFKMPGTAGMMIAGTVVNDLLKETGNEKFLTGRRKNKKMKK